MLVVIAPAATFDVEDAANAYEATRIGWGDRFLTDLRNVRVRISEYPLGCPEVYPRVRRALMHWFPFGVHYVVSDDSIQIIAVLPTRADPFRVPARGCTFQA